MKKSHVILLLIASAICLQSTISKGNSLSTTHTLRDSTSFLGIYPLVFYLPETRLGFTLAGIYTFRAEGNTDNKASNLQAGIGYTLNKQILTYGFFNIWRKQNSQLIRGEIGYYDYFYPFYGIGPDTDETDVEDYFVRFPRIKANYLVSTNKIFYAGPAMHLDWYNVYDTEDGGLLQTEDISGSEGGIVSGLGLAATLDRRDVQFYPRKGQFLEASLLFYNSIIGSDYDYPRFSITASQYIPVTQKMVLALNYLHEYAGDDAPLQELALYGGPKYARGYVIGRYRDHHQAVLQAELRFPIFWRFKGAAFASAGNVSDELSTITDDIKINYGLGLRFLLSKDDQLNIRLDYGVSSEGGNVYLTIGEAF